MQKYILLLMLSLVQVLSRGQTPIDIDLSGIPEPTHVESIRYWFDDDARSLSSSTLLNGSYTLDASSLLDGLHTIHCQIVDNKGMVANPYSAIFIKMVDMGGNSSETVTPKKLMYWFDEETELRNVDMVTGIQVLDASHLLDGLHTLHYQVICSDGTITSAYSAIFMRVNITFDDAAVAAKSLRYWFDDDNSTLVETDITDGMQTLDVSQLQMGLHTVHCQLVDEKGEVLSAYTALFMKMADMSADKENAITGYMYWQNDKSRDNSKVELTHPASPYNLVSLIPVPESPVRSSSFQFEILGDKPMMYAKNDVHIRFYDARGYWADDSRTFIDYRVGKEVTNIENLLTIQTFTRPEENGIKWFKFEAAPGDTIAFRSSQATSIQVFSPSGKEIYSALGDKSVKYDGAHTWEDGTYYVAIHDVTGSQPSITLDYMHMDKYDVVDQDVRVVGNGGCSTITFRGNGFKDLHAVDLYVEQEDTIHSIHVGHESDAETSVIFDFTDAKLGKYNALFHFAEEDKTFADIIIVEEAKEIELSVKVSYPSRFLRGTATTYTISMTNSGNMTAYYVPTYMSVQCNERESISKILVKGLEIPPLYEDGDLENVPIECIDQIKELISSKGDDLRFIKLWKETDANDSIFIRILDTFITIPPQSTLTFFVEITSTDDVLVNVTIPNEWIPCSTGELSRTRIARKVSVEDIINGYCCIRDRIECSFEATAIVLDIAGTIMGFIPGLEEAALVTGLSSCMTSYTADQLKEFGNALCNSDNSSFSKAIINIVNARYKAVFAMPSLSTILGCVGSILSALDVSKELSNEVLKAVVGGLASTCSTFASAVDLDNIENGRTSCSTISEVKPNCPPNSKDDGGTSTSVASLDPNDIYGYIAPSGSKFVADSIIALNYRIEFENDTTFATASAHTVIVKDILDATKFDFASYQPTSIKIGDKDVQLKGDKEFVTTIDMRPEINAIAQVEGLYDEKKGIATWQFTSLDPMTMEPTDDIMQGILPVNYDGSGIGEVAYNINRKAGLSDGTAISNKASIVFDSNDAIETPVWTNTIDAVPPTSYISGLVMQNDSVFDLRFEGEDNRSGVWKYNLYVQDGLKAPWREVATDIAPDSVYTFKGFDCIDYGFCVLATDSAGNVERKPLEPEVRKMASLRGDANADGEVNVIDLNATVNYIMGQPSARFNAMAADVNKNGKVNVADLNGIVNIILSEESNESSSILKARAKAAALSDERIYSEDMDVVPGDIQPLYVYLDNAHDATSLQFDLMLPEGVRVVKHNHEDYAVTLSERAECTHSVMGAYKKDGVFRVVAYSPDNQNFASNSGLLMTLMLKIDERMEEGTYEVMLRNIMLATREEEGLDVLGGKSAISVYDPTSIRVSKIPDDPDEGYTVAGIKRRKNQKGVKVTEHQKVLVK